MPKATKSDLSLSITRVFNAPREKIFRAWTDADQIAKWFAPEGLSVPTAEVDATVGGQYRIAMAPPGGNPWFVAGTYREVKAPEKLVFTWQWEQPTDVDAGETLVTVEFNERGGATEVVLTHEHLVSEEEKVKHEKGWMGCLQQLEKVL